MKIQMKIKKYYNGMFEIFPVGISTVYVRGNDKIIVNFKPSDYSHRPCLKRFAERFWK